MSIPIATVYQSPQGKWYNFPKEPINEENLVYEMLIFMYSIPISTWAGTIKLFMTVIYGFS